MELRKNYNHTHRPSGQVITSTAAQITVGDLRNAIAGYPDDAEIHISPCDHGGIQRIFGFKDRGPKHLSLLVCGPDEEE